MVELKRSVKIYGKEVGHYENEQQLSECCESGKYNLLN